MNIISDVILVFALAIIAALVFAMPIWVLWNWLMPSIFGVNEISIFQAFGLLLLAKLLVKSNISIDIKNKIL